MAEIMETMMLICFGFSWPLNVYRNYKAKSAKGMSLSFTLLIICGYLAGIGAKLMTQNYSYVLIVYAFNLIAVSLNVAIYFRNRHLDNIRTVNN